MSDLDLMLKFMLQVVVLIGACKVMGWIGSRFLAQAQVVMEMVTGVILGPSLFGLFYPEAQSWLFPTTIEVFANGRTETIKHPSMMILYVVANIGLILYMFLVGLEFDTETIKGKLRGAVSVSIAGMAAPFALAMLLVYTILGSDDRFFAPHIGIHTAALYLGAAMCITAFPMLARIIYERGIAGTTLGTLSLSAGATNDAAAWCLLAIVLAISKGDPSYAVVPIVGGIVFTLLVLTAGRRLAARLADAVQAGRTLSTELFMTVILLLMAGAFVADWIGIHAVFGAFLIGSAMPKGKLAEALRDKLEYVTVGFFLPFFFVYSGLNTQILLIDSLSLVGVTLLVLAAAMLGKGVACALAARASGETWRASWAIGTLMNARGLMELIILNIALQQGVITPTLFTIMVCMAIVTTLIASPLFIFIHRRFTAADLAIAERPAAQAS